jgi:diphosphomevalonate decarboxylase
VPLDFGSTTTIAAFSDTDSFRLNGRKEALTTRLQTATTFFKARTDRCFSIQSDNDFPTAAGFASSAAAASAFVGALAALAGDTEAPIEYWLERNVNISILARKVSGSGSRFVFGGFVEWVPGNSEIRWRVAYLAHLIGRSFPFFQCAWMLDRKPFHRLLE